MQTLGRFIAVILTTAIIIVAVSMIMSAQGG